MTASTALVPEGAVEVNVLVDAIRDAANSGSGLRTLDSASGSWSPRRWSDILVVAESVAAQLVARDAGSTPPPAVAVVGEPSADMVAVVVGAWMAGRPSTIIAGPNRLMSLDAWTSQLDVKFRELGVDAVFSHGSALRAITQRWGGQSALWLADIREVGQLPPAPSTFRSVPRASGAAAVFQGTAGSTGTPKSVALTARATLNQIRAVLERQDYRDGDVLCSWLPLYHDLGLTMLLAGMISGAPTWIAPTSAFAKAPFEWLTWLDESRASVTAAPNFAYALMGRYARVVKGADLSALRVAISGGELVDVDATEQFATSLGAFGFSPEAVCCSYGLAEASCGLTMPQAGSGLDVDEVTVGGELRRVARLGTPMAGVEIRIMASEHRTEFDEHRTVGEIEFRSTSQMSGYVGEPPVAADEWIKTGDLGYKVGSDLVVCGRSKELITIAGRNIFPQEVERVAASVSGLRPGAVAVVSRRGAQARGEQLVIVAEYMGEDAASAREAIIEKVSAECGITPGVVDFVDSLPKTTSGKLRRVAIAEQYT